VTAVALFCLDGIQHCWHSAELQHALTVNAGVHTDEVCCWCGTTSCRDVYTMKRRTGDHGDHMPSQDIERHTRTKAKNAIAFYRSRQPKRAKNPLEPRQAEYLQLLSTGMNKKELMEFFGWTRWGIKARQTKIRKSLGAKTTIHALAIAIRNKYI
jgi:DNA-binding CsgD family transcriptional regulator